MVWYIQRIFGRQRRGDKPKKTVGFCLVEGGVVGGGSGDGGGAGENYKRTFGQPVWGKRARRSFKFPTALIWSRDRLPFRARRPRCWQTRRETRL